MLPTVKGEQQRTKTQVNNYMNTHWLRHPMEAIVLFIHSASKQASVQMLSDRSITKDKQKFGGLRLPDIVKARAQRAQAILT